MDDPVELTPENLERFWMEAEEEYNPMAGSPWISTSSTGGQKEVKKQRMDLLPWDALLDLSELYAFGTIKYSPNNWRAGYEWSKSIAALHRHMALWVGGEEIDSETQLDHLLSVVFHALALHTWSKNPDLRLKFDDRYKG